MSLDTIIQKIEEKAHNLLEQDLDEWVVPELSTYYQTKIRSLAAHAYGSAVNGTEDGPSVALQAFRERARAELRKGVHTFYFVSEHWRSNRDINSYLLTCLNRLADKVKNDAASIKKVSAPICPACKVYGERSFLKYDNKQLRCSVCFDRLHSLEESKSSESEIRLRKIFTLHSRAGRRCPDCERFIPESYLKSYGISCPYDDCWWFGADIFAAQTMAHPLGLCSDNILSLDYVSKDSGNALLDYLLVPSKDEISAEDRLAAAEKYEKELEILNEVIDVQMNRVKMGGIDDKTSIQKYLMYQAYKNMVSSYPEEMVSYLVHLKHFGVESPIQSRVFQEYVRLVENALPIISTKNGQKYEICSLLDENLGLFLGISEFDATVKSDRSIPNNTVETYTGGRKLKFFGPCFIGLLIDVVDKETGKSLKEDIKSYTFVQIKMNENVKPGTSVKVTHFRMTPHYEMQGMVFLQRIRRKLVDSVYFRIHKKKRVARKPNEKA